MTQTTAKPIGHDVPIMTEDWVTKDQLKAKKGGKVNPEKLPTGVGKCIVESKVCIEM
jgi:hypothetical protein